MLTSVPPSADDVHQFILNVLENEPCNRILGARLSVLLRERWKFKPADYGCLNQREFIRRYCVDVTEVDRAGADYVFGRVGGKSVASAAHALEGVSSSAWKTFTSPNPAFALWVDPTRSLYVRPKDATPPAGWATITSLTAEQLRSIAEHYLRQEVSLSEDTSLLGLLGLPNWWPVFTDALAKRGLKSRWLEFRSLRIADALNQAVADAIPDPWRDDARARTQSNPGPPATHSSLRRIVLDAVSRMTDSELRNLSLPVGYVVDSIGHKE